MPTARRCLRLSLGLVLLAAPALRAQTAPTKSAAVLTGTVVDARGTALADADVLVLGPERTARSSATGTFRVDALAATDYMVLVRRIGYSPALFSVTVAAQGDNAIRVELAPTAMALSELSVTGNGRFAAMARRLREGRSLVLSSDRLARFPSVRSALDLEVPVRFVSGSGGPAGRGCLVYVINGGIPTTDADLDQIGRGDLMVGRRPSSMRASTALDPSQLPISALTAVEFIPPEFVASEYPQVRQGCAVVQLWI